MRDKIKPHQLSLTCRQIAKSLGTPGGKGKKGNLLFQTLCNGRLQTHWLRPMVSHHSERTEGQIWENLWHITHFYWIAAASQLQKYATVLSNEQFQQPPFIFC